LGENLKSKMAIVMMVPNQILRPSEEVIPSNTIMDINIVNVLVKRFKSLQKINDIKIEEQISKYPPKVRW
tara:strand:+ start:489 stop:698 length:210 start_codon:yes stop_codon:yes gene_type:complete